MKVKENIFGNGETIAWVKDWFLTDDDCLQYCRIDPYDKKKGTYQFVQYIEFDEDDYTLVTDTVDIYDFIGVNDEQAYEYIIDLLESYGYGISTIRGNMDDADYAMALFIEFKNQYGGDSWKQIFAECMFENQIFSADKIGTHLSTEQMYLTLSNFLQNN